MPSALVRFRRLNERRIGAPEELDRISSVVLGLDGFGGAERFADYTQWEAWQVDRLKTRKPDFVRRRPTPQEAISRSSARKKLSYLEAREYATIEQRIAHAEAVVKEKQAALEDPTIVSDAPRLVTAQAELDDARRNLDSLYARWSELEEKQA